MDRTRVAERLGLAALTMAPLAVAAYGWVNPGFGRFSPLESALLAFGPPILLATVATVFYFSLPPGRRVGADAAPLSLAVLLLLPVLMVGLWMWAMSRMGDI